MMHAMDLTPFKQDIDKLIQDFAESDLRTFSDMKRLWISRKFSYIFEARISGSRGLFMQSLYAHSIGYMISTASLSCRLGGLYCLYCLHEIQPFKPPFKIYISLGELKKLKDLVIEAKRNDIRVVPALVKKMLQKNIFLFGSVDLREDSETERMKQAIEVQNARVQVAYDAIFSGTRIEHFLHMDVGMEVDLDVLQRMSSQYSDAKKQAIAEASKVVDVQNIKHISEDKDSLSNTMENVNEEWNNQRQKFYKKTGLKQPEENQQLQLIQTSQQQDGEDNFDKELELLLCQD